MSEAERARLAAEVRAEESSLRAAARKQARDSDGVSDEMVASCQRLLQLFGVPFITAPAEAEAQCAQLERAGLVDGIVTEDNDTFLFGGRRVYRRLFDQARDVELYLMDDVEAELKLGRNELIQLACLLGSDYTDGVRGVGVVNGVEVVRAFTPANGGLRAFARWVRVARRRRGGGGGGRRRRHGGVAAVQIEPQDGAAQLGARRRLPERCGGRGVHASRRRRIRRAVRVGAAEPPRAPLLLSGEIWLGRGQSRRVVVPVMQAYDVTHSQARIDGYFPFERRFATYSSSRLASAVGAGGGAARARGRRGRGGGGRGGGERGRGGGGGGGAEEGAPAPKKPPKRAKKDSGAPKRGLSAFMFFSSAERERVKAENPEASFGELGKILGARWKEMDDEAREPYVAKAAEDKASYEREKKAAAGASAVTAAGEDSDSEDLPIG